MEIKEAVNLLNNIKAGVKKYDEAIAMAVDALEEKDKYRWHDLRKNPNDLPEEEECVVLVSMNGRFGHTEYEHTPEEGYWIKGESFFAEKEKNKLVEAWKYIELFEEEQHDE